MAALQEQLGAGAARIGDAEPVDGPPTIVPPPMSTCWCGLEHQHRRLDHRIPQAEARGQVRAGQLADEVKRFEGELHDEIERQARLLQRGGRRWRRDDVLRGSIHDQERGALPRVQSADDSGVTSPSWRRFVRGHVALGSSCAAQR